MKRWFIAVLAASALALAGLVGAFVLAPMAQAAGHGARDGTGPIIGAAFGPGEALGLRNGAGPLYAANGSATGQQYSLVAVAADQLNMGQTDLVAELQSGKTVAQVATEKQVDTSKIVDAFIAPRAESLNQRVADGQLTQAQADAMLAAMQAHVTEQLNEPWTQWTGSTGAGYVDVNGDGVCDHLGTGAGPMYER
jgi:hypothetical protein